MFLYQKDDVCHFIFAIPFPMEGITLGNGIVMESYVNNKLLEFSSHAMFVLELSIVTW